MLGSRSRLLGGSGLYTKAAGFHYVPSFANIALMYDNGLGVPEDNQIAIDWYRKGADRGDASARTNL
jgi:TPR repeat protein